MTPEFAAAALAHAIVQRDEAADSLARLQAKDPKSEKVAEAKAILKRADEAVKVAEADVTAAPPSTTGTSGGTAHDATIVTT